MLYDNKLLYFCLVLRIILYMAQNVLFQIDIEKIIQNKSSGSTKKIPKFLISWLKKLVKQDEINDALKYIGEDTGVDAMVKLVNYFNLTIKFKGEENIPDSGNYVFASNHPLGGMDGICLSAVLGQRYQKKIKYLVNDLLFFLKPLQPIFVPINKLGPQAKASAILVNEAFASDNQIITFPAGLCSRKNKGKICDPEWKKAFIVKAVEYQRDIIPIYFEGRNSNLFYRIANIRKWLGIKINIEMLWLPGEVFKQKNASFTIHFGKPIPWQTFDKSKAPDQWAENIKSIVYQMGKKL